MELFLTVSLMLWVLGLLSYRIVIAVCPSVCLFVTRSGGVKSGRGSTARRTSSIETQVAQHSTRRRQRSSQRGNRTCSEEDHSSGAYE